MQSSERCSPCAGLRGDVGVMRWGAVAPRWRGAQTRTRTAEMALSHRAERESAGGTGMRELCGAGGTAAAEIPGAEGAARPCAG